MCIQYPDMGSLVEDSVSVSPLNNAAPSDTLGMFKASHKSLTVPKKSETASVGETSAITNANLVETPELSRLLFCILDI